MEVMADGQESNMRKSGWVGGWVDSLPSYLNLEVRHGLFCGDGLR